MKAALMMRILFMMAHQAALLHLSVVVK